MAAAAVRVGLLGRHSRAPSGLPASVPWLLQARGRVGSVRRLPCVSAPWGGTGHPSRTPSAVVTAVYCVVQTFLPPEPRGEPVEAVSPSVTCGH